MASVEFRSRGQRATLLIVRVLAVALPLLVALGSATGAIRVGLGGARGALVSGGVGAMVVPAPVLTGFALFLAVALFVGLLTRPAEVSVDEGGVRWCRGRRAGYVPFARVRDVTSGRRALILETDSGRVRLPLGNLPALGLLGAVSARIARRAGVLDAPEETALLARRGRGLLEWLEAVRDATQLDRRSDAYRMPPAPVEALEALATDERRAPELRAAATHALLARCDEALAARIAAGIGPGTPPIVVAAAALAAPGRIDRALVEEAERFLDAQDRRALKASPRRPDAGEPPGAVPRLRVAESPPGAVPRLRVAESPPPQHADPEDAAPSSRAQRAQTPR